MPVTIPQDRNEGDAGHITDHDTINDALAALSATADDLTARFPSGKLSVSDVAPASPAVGDVWIDISGAV